MPHALKPIIVVSPPNAIIYDESFWDELRDGGISEVCLIRNGLLDDLGERPQRIPTRPEYEHPRALAAVGGSPVESTQVAAFDPNPELYRDMPYSVPALPARLADESSRLKEAVRLGTEKGFSVWFVDDKGQFMDFPSGRQNLEARHLCDPDVVALLVARAVDTMANFPEFAGILTDGQNYKWDIKPGHPDDIWVEALDSDHSRKFANDHGISMQRVLDGRDRFQEMLRSLSAAAVDDFVRNRAGAFGAGEWWLESPDIVEWLRFKLASVEWHIASIYAGLKERLPELRVGVMSRMPACAMLAGYNARLMRAHCDFQMPKEYWWAGGVAGFRGTVINWVDTLVEWNPGLSPEEATRWFSAAFDYPVTSGYPVSEYAKEAPDEWFETSVADQTRKMIAGAGGAARTVPVVSLEHSGTWLSDRELLGILRVMQQQGITRYAYLSYNSLTPEIWSVITGFGRG